VGSGAKACATPRQTVELKTVRHSRWRKNKGVVRAVLAQGFGLRAMTVMGVRRDKEALSHLYGHPVRAPDTAWSRPVVGEDVKSCPMDGVWKREQRAS
jgi:hypothetical protein